MNSFQESLEKLRLENENIKEEIVSYLCQLTEVGKMEETEDPYNVQNTHFLTELCKHEQLVNHKLTQIKFDLIKFQSHYKLPQCESAKTLNETSHFLETDQDDVDIGKLKETSFKMIEKLDRWIDNSEKTFEKESYPYLPEITLNELSEHTKEMYKEIRQEIVTPCEHEIDLQLNFPFIFKSCHKKSKNLSGQKAELLNNIKKIEDETNPGQCEHEVDLQKKNPSIFKSCHGSSTNLSEQEEKLMEIIENKEYERNQVQKDGHMDKNLPKSILDCSLQDLEIFAQNTEPNQKKEKVKSNVNIGKLLDIESLDDFLIVESENECEGIDIENSAPSTQNDQDLGNENDANDTKFPQKEIVKPSEGLEEKIKKLGLKDRFTLNEMKRPRAYLPDLRLQPSISDSEKLKIKNDFIEYIIEDRAAPKVNDSCVFSHIESPDEFYIQIIDEESLLLENLNQFITDKFKNTAPRFRSKAETWESMSDFCCAYVKDKRSYFRVKIEDWLFEQGTKLVLARLVDYGSLEYAHYKHLRELSEELCYIPKMALKCYFPLLYPPGSTKRKIVKEWPITSVKALTDLCSLSETVSKPIFKLIHVQNDENMFGVDMIDPSNQNQSSVGELMISLGHAVEIITRKDDPQNLIGDELDIENLENCNNLNEVIYGYNPRDEARICPFKPLNNGRCFKGANCKLEHTRLPEGGYTSDKHLIYTWSSNEILMPKKGDKILMKFSTTINASHYYIHLVQFEHSLKKLENMMNDERNVQTYRKFKILPATGEIVLTKHWSNGRWVRAKVLHQLMDEEGNCVEVQVSIVDHGDINDVPMRNVRMIKPEFMELPFQAIECMFYDYMRRKDVAEEKFSTFFYENMCNRKFSATVMGKCGSILYLKVHYQGESVAEMLWKRGYLIQASSIIPENTIILPG